MQNRMLTAFILTEHHLLLGQLQVYSQKLNFMHTVSAFAITVACAKFHTLACETVLLASL
jgi:hypothetical protein